MPNLQDDALPTPLPEPDREMIEGLRALLEKVDSLPWHAGHLTDDTTNCDCPYIFDQGHAGGVGQVYIDNGLSISDGGNDAPSKDEAKANLALIVAAVNALPRLLSLAQGGASRGVGDREAVAELVRAAKRFIECSTKPGVLSPYVKENGRIGTASPWTELCEAVAPAEAALSLPGAGGEVPAGWRDTAVECHGLDTPERVCFYEQDFYVLSNFSSFSVMWEANARQGLVRFDTSEHLYHWLKFSGEAQPKRVATSDQWTIAAAVRAAPSAHEAFKIAERHRSHRRRDWDEIKVGVMRAIIRAKAEQHEYVRRKLLATGDRELVENSWRDDFWGWGPNRDGQNMLGKLWMELRTELLAAAPPLLEGEGK